MIAFFWLNRIYHINLLLLSKEILEKQQQTWSEVIRLQDNIFHRNKIIHAYTERVEEALQNNSLVQADLKLLEHDLKHLKNLSASIKKNISQIIQFEKKIIKNAIIDGALNVRGFIKVRNASIEAINGQNMKELLTDIVR